MNAAEALLSAIEVSVKDQLPDGKPGVLFSGGLDSSIIAHILGRYSDPCLYTVGVEGSYDLAVGRETASFLGLEWKGITVGTEDLIGAVCQLMRIIPTTNPVTLSFELPLHIVASRVEEVHLFNGQGADELFAGYAKYLSMDVEERKRHMESDLANLMDKGLSFERTIAAHHGKVIHHPYLHQRVVAQVEGISPESLIHGSIRKKALREVAELLQLGEIVTRRKKAAQYGSGIMKSLKSEARRRRTTLRSLMRELAEIPID